MSLWNTSYYAVLQTVQDSARKTIIVHPCIPMLSRWGSYTFFSMMMMSKVEWSGRGGGGGCRGSLWLEVTLTDLKTNNRKPCRSQGLQLNLHMVAECSLSSDFNTIVGNKFTTYLTVGRQPQRTRNSLCWQVYHTSYCGQTATENQKQPLLASLPHILLWADSHREPETASVGKFTTHKLFQSKSHTDMLNVLRTSVGTHSLLVLSIN